MHVDLGAFVQAAVMSKIQTATQKSQRAWITSELRQKFF